MSKTVFLAMGEYEHNNKSFLIAAFSNEQDALQATKGQGQWGQNGHVSKVEVFDSIKEYNESKLKIEKQNALEKLSKAEKDALGIEK